jgi:hypothetical protein
MSPSLAVGPKQYHTMTGNRSKNVNTPPADNGAGREGSGKTPRPDRRGSDRVKNEQGSGHGSASALSRMKMIERRKSQVRPKNGQDNGGN